MLDEHQPFGSTRLYLLGVIDACFVPFVKVFLQAFRGEESRSARRAPRRTSPRRARIWGTAICLAFALVLAPCSTTAQTLLDNLQRIDLSPLVSQEEAVVVSIRASGPIARLRSRRE